MKTTEDKLSSKNITFANACRENTGAAMCDSGDYYGRHWEKKDVPDAAVEIVEWDDGCPATISTAAYLDSRFEIDRKLQKYWESYSKKDRDCTWFESADGFMKGLGYVERHRDNVYNEDNNLDQVFVYAAWQLVEHDTKGDWIYEDDGSVVTVIFIHTGCDVRGGYGRPIFCRKTGEYNVPMDLCAEYHAELPATGPLEPGRPTPPINLLPEERQELQEIDEQWTNSYTSYPYGALEKDVAEWHEDTRTRDSVEVTLHTGKRILVRARLACA
jgi:hypothetical protein